MEDIYHLKPLGDYSTAEKAQLSTLEDQRLSLLKAEEEAWRLNIWAIWVKSGDKNMSFFHKYANFRRITNAVWDIVGSDGQILNSQMDLDEVARLHFKHIFADPKVTNINTQLNLLKAFPKMVMDSDNVRLGAPAPLIYQLGARVLVR